MLNRIADHIKKLALSIPATEKVKEKYIKRIDEGNLTKDENPQSHFCVYFAAFDPKIKQVFIGHHKKSGLWLFNGGHLNKDEFPEEALEREIKEEWGNKIIVNNAYSPTLLTITEINNPPKQKCKLHYDIWNFITVNKNSFFPDKNLLKKEFYQTGWHTIQEAKKIIKDSNTLLALDKLEYIFESRD